MRARNALGRHVALVGFMGAGKSTIGAQVAERLGRELVDVDSEIERELGASIDEIFARRGEPEFRTIEERMTVGLLDRSEPAVLALGGGAVGARRIREALAARALTVWLEIEPDTAWRRAAGSGRPLARDEAQFRSLYEERQALYEEAADACARDADGVVLAAAGVHVETGALERLGGLVPGDGPVALVSDVHVAGIHGPLAQMALGGRLASTHELPQGEAAKSFSSLQHLWEELQLDRRGTVVALGGGCTTDAAGFAAATYLRGVSWVSVPTTLVAQVDAAIGGKTGINLSTGKNLVGAFHWPARVVVDPATLETLPDAQRLEGMAEVVKTGLLGGEELWALPDEALVRGCAAYKSAICLRDPEEGGLRAVLNLGHTFAHALEAAGAYGEVTHGRAVALGLRAALRLSVDHLGLDASVAEVVERELSPKPVAVDPARAWAALHRDKKAERGRPKLVLLEAPGRPVTGVELPEDDVRRALDRLIAG